MLIKLTMSCFSKIIRQFLPISFKVRNFRKLKLKTKLTSFCSIIAIYFAVHFLSGCTMQRILEQLGISVYQRDHNL